MIRNLNPNEYPELLREIPEPPKRLRYEGTLPIPGNKLLTIVGARKNSQYGKDVCEELILSLSGQPITIISGLALGIDAIAHRASIRAGLQTIAVPGSGLSRKVLYPRTNVNLAQEILENGGGLLSEFEDDMPAYSWSFPKRNRIMAGMCHATIVVEAEKKSGTLITSRLATEYNREVGAIPGSIFSTTSEGPHLLLKLGASIIRDKNDVLELLRLDAIEDKISESVINELSNEEKTIMSLLDEPKEKNELLRQSGIDTSLATAILSLLEIKGLIKEEMGEVKKTFI